MIPEFTTAAAPEAHGVGEWLARLRANQELSKAQEVIFNLARKFPDNEGLQKLLAWHDPVWWRPIEFGDISLKRRGPEYFDFLWSLVLNREFSSRLKNIPHGITPNNMLHVLTKEASSIIPESRAITWIVFRGGIPIGTSMLVNINLKNRNAEQIMGLLPGHSNPIDVANTYTASLCFAFNSLGLNKIKGLIYAENEEVALLQEKLGFKREGVFREELWSEELQKYLDLIQISLLHSDFAANLVLQSYIRRAPRSPFLLERRQWPRNLFPVSPE